MSKTDGAPKSAPSSPVRSLPPARPRVRLPRLETIEPKETDDGSLGDKEESHSDGAREPEYKVGYKRPPKHTRFKAGQIANPKGRPRKSRSFWCLFEEELDAKVVARIGGKTVSITARQAAAKQLAAKVVTGEKGFLELWLKYEQLKQASEQTPSEPDLSEEEAASLEAYIARLSGSGNEGGES